MGRGGVVVGDEPGGACLPAGLAVDAPALPSVAMLAGVIRAAEGPLHALHTTGAQALAPRRPGGPPTVHWGPPKTPCFSLAPTINTSLNMHVGHADLNTNTFCLYIRQKSEDTN